MQKENSFFFVFALPRYANSDRWFRESVRSDFPLDLWSLATALGRRTLATEGTQEGTQEFATAEQDNSLIT